MKKFATIVGYFLAVFLATLAVAQDRSPLLFNGRVINDLGEPMEGAQVQFWHTDENGNYNHPRFNTGGVSLLPDFQYFGTATTAADGSFQFRTIRPGIYAARPITHIHYKVWWNGNDVLTSQFYFMDEGTSQPPLLQLALVEQEDGTLLTNKTIALNMGLGGSEQITPAQTAGPFYPVVDFFELDGDLTAVTPDEQQQEQEQQQGTPPTPNDSPTQAPQAPQAGSSPTISQGAPSDATAETTSSTTTATGSPTFSTDPDPALNGDSSMASSSFSPEIRVLFLVVLMGLGLVAA